MQGLDVLIIVADRHALGIGQGFLQLGGEFILAHQALRYSIYSRSWAEQVIYKMLPSSDDLQHRVQRGIE
ncbi:hypothetical protein ACFS07_16645 [Undibacterium arcticum]